MRAYLYTHCTYSTHNVKKHHIYQQTTHSFPLMQLQATGLNIAYMFRCNLRTEREKDGKMVSVDSNRVPEQKLLWNKQPSGCHGRSPDMMRSPKTIYSFILLILFYYICISVFLSFIYLFISYSFLLLLCSSSHFWFILLYIFCFVLYLRILYLAWCNRVEASNVAPHYESISNRCDFQNK